MLLSHNAEAWQAHTYRRALLGLYVCVHFAMLVPYAAELFSRVGMVADAGASPLIHAFPNVLAWLDTPSFVQGFVVLGAASGLTLAYGVWPRASAVIAYYVWACLFGRNPLIANPSLPYVGLMLLACAVVGRPRREVTRQEMSRVTTLLWIAMAAGYSYSGLTKCTSLSWLDGSAVHAVLQSPLSRPHALRDFLLGVAPFWLTLVTYGALAVEILFAPLALSARLRPWLWLAMTGMHVSLIALIQFADLSLGMLVLHAFTFDPEWLRRRSKVRETAEHVREQELPLRGAGRVRKTLA